MLNNFSKFLLVITGRDEEAFLSASKTARHLCVAQSITLVVILLLQFMCFYFSFKLVFGPGNLCRFSALLISFFWVSVNYFTYYLSISTMNLSGLSGRKNIYYFFGKLITWFFRILFLIVSGMFFVGFMYMTCFYLIKSDELFKILVLPFAFLFLMPFMLQLIISKSSYSVVSHKMKNEFILTNYSLFKEKYSEIFKSKFHLDVSFHENYTDPPFNFIPREAKPSKQKGAFFNDLINSQTN